MTTYSKAPLRSRSKDLAQICLGQVPASFVLLLARLLVARIVGRLRFVIIVIVRMLRLVIIVIVGMLLVRVLVLVMVLVLVREKLWTPNTVKPAIACLQ